LLQLEEAIEVLRSLPEDLGVKVAHHIVMLTKVHLDDTIIFTESHKQQVIVYSF